MEKELKTRAQIKRLKRDAQIKELWDRLSPVKGTETIAMETIAEQVDCSISTVRRLLKSNTPPDGKGKPIT